MVTVNGLVLPFSPLSKAFLPSEARVGSQTRGDADPGMHHFEEHGIMYSWKQ